MWIVWLEKKILKTLGILLGSIIILLTALHIYVVNNAEKLIEDLVETRSDNKLKLKVKNIKFNYFSRKVELENVVFYSGDSPGLKTAYRFTVNNIKLKVRGLLPIFTRKELLIDSLYLAAPEIEVTRLKPSDTSARREVSIPEEMGKIYNSIIDALKLLQVNRFELNDGKFTLYNKMQPQQQPLIITNLHFHIDNLRIDTSQQTGKFLFSDQMVFRTRNQDITFPDGNHRLAFSRFRINIRKQLIEIDSCTLSGRRADSSRSAFSVFFDTLMLANVDFKALYEKELIKADSVYCLNPRFKITLEPKNKSRGKTLLPDTDTLIQQLTGDLQLNYVGVKNALLDITTYRNDQPSSFTSANNNFEMEGLTIDRSLLQPVSLRSFSMAIRNYENFLKDSSYFLRFDSILLRENRILLSNFSVNTDPFIDSRNIQVQQFALSGLSWPELLFNRKVKAAKAILYNPVIDYTEANSKKNKPGKNITRSLYGINNLMELERLQVINGQIKMKTKKIPDLILENANLVLNSRQALVSANAGNIEQSVESLSFSKGILRINDLTVKMGKSNFDGGSNKLFLEKITMYNRRQTINIAASKFVADNMVIGGFSKSISAAGIRWQQATVEANVIGGEKEENQSPLTISLQNIKGNSTQVNINSINGSYSAWLNHVSAARISKQSKLVIEGLAADGKNFTAGNSVSDLSIENFAITDKHSSSFNSLRFYRLKDSNSLELYIPRLSLEPDIVSITGRRPDLKKVKLEQPELIIKTKTKLPAENKGQKTIPEINLDQVEIIRPLLILENSDSSELKELIWKSTDAKLMLKHIRTKDEEIRIRGMEGLFSNFSLLNGKGKKITTREGRLDVKAENILLRPGDTLQWRVLVKEAVAENFESDNTGEKKIKWKVNTGKIENLQLGSQFISSLAELVKRNGEFAANNITGYINDEKNNWRWYNFSYYNTSRTASLDSFSFHPLVSRETFIAASPWQTDYMRLTTGRISINRLDIDRYFKDSVVNAGDIIISNPYFTSYRDKRPPFRAGIIKPLPTELLRKIPQKFSFDTIKIINGTAVYGELNDKTKETGTLPVTRISGDIFPVKNYNFSTTDSLRIRLNGYLMDSAWLRLRVRESYTDSPGGFLITIRMRPRSLLYLNPVLGPLASVRLQSGNLDTLVMRAVGKEYLSLGEMKMFYKDLKVQFLANDTESKKRFLRGLMTFIANSFVIKNENRNRTGVVYFPRLRDRSFINYYIKIAMSGVASSVGAKRNKKLLRRYERQLKVRQLPPVDFD